MKIKINANLSKIHENDKDENHQNKTNQINNNSSSSSKMIIIILITFNTITLHSKIIPDRCRFTPGQKMIKKKKNNNNNNKINKKKKSIN